MSPGPVPLALQSGSGDRVRTVDGRTLIDLELGFGSAFLGHAHPGVTAALQAQAAQLLACGRRPTQHSDVVQALLAARLPAGLRPAGLYSTGMEVAEYALRVAAVHTGRHEFVAFARSMHGKSGMTAGLCWPNAPLRPGGLHTLPFVDDAGEDDILQALEDRLRGGRVAALLVEPVQGSNLAHEASVDFYAQAIALCRAHGSLCIFDETLTGLHRTGPVFYASRLPLWPDMLIFAKCLGNGFPVSSLALSDAVEAPVAALPSSTFSANALALAAVESTLAAMDALPMVALVQAHEAQFQALRSRLQDSGVVLRGRGALWSLAFAQPEAAARTAAAAVARGLMVSSTGRSIRLLPSATMPPALLAQACDTLASCCARANG